MAERSLTVVTWNLQGSRGVDVDAVAAHVRAVEADVLALQEVQRRQARSLARALEAGSLSWGFKHWPITTWPEGMALVGVSAPVVGVRTRALTARLKLTSWRRRIVQAGRVAVPGPADVPVDGPEVGLVNVHLSPHREAADVRRREVARILADHTLASRAGAGPTIVAGDFNTEPGTPPWEQMREAGFSTPEKGPTYWRGTPSDRPPEREIDYVWAPEGIEIDEVELPRHGEPGFDRFPRISDHLPVTVRLRVAG